MQGLQWRMRRRWRCGSEAVAGAGLIAVVIFTWYCNQKCGDGSLCDVLVASNEGVYSCEERVMVVDRRRGTSCVLE